MKRISKNKENTARRNLFYRSAFRNHFPFTFRREKKRTEVAGGGVIFDLYASVKQDPTGKLWENNEVEDRKGRHLDGPRSKESGASLKNRIEFSTKKWVKLRELTRVRKRFLINIHLIAIRCRTQTLDKSSFTISRYTKYFIISKRS